MYVLRTSAVRSSKKFALLLRLGSLPDYGDRAVGVPYHRLGHTAHQGPPYPSVPPAAHHYQPDAQTLGQVDDLLVGPSLPQVCLLDGASRLLDRPYLFIEPVPCLASEFGGLLLGLGQEGRA